MSNLNPADMIQWFRAKADEFNGIAESLERTFNPNGAPNIGSPIVTQRATRERKVAPVPILVEDASIESIKRAVSVKSYRANALAARFRCSEDEILDLVETEGSGLTVAQRGWIKLESQQEDGENLL